MKVRDAQKWRNRLIISGFIIMILSSWLDCIWAIGLGLIVMVSGLIPERYNKCPHCGKALGRNGGDYCHHCGGRIEE